MYDVVGDAGGLSMQRKVLSNKSASFATRFELCVILTVFQLSLVQ